MISLSNPASFCFLNCVEIPFYLRCLSNNPRCRYFVFLVLKESMTHHAKQCVAQFMTSG